jgi:NAD(P)H-dependent FMN reductase
MSKLNLQVMVASVREGRAGLSIGQWFLDTANRFDQFDVELVDLKRWNLPLMDEPMHPRLEQYKHQHTKDWSRQIDKGDAFVFVIPEYNYSMSAPLKNALDYLSREWSYKPVGFVSYGGISGGTRAVQVAKQVVTTLRMMPLPEAVNIPFYAKYRDAEGHFQATEEMEQSAETMLKELHRWATHLKPMRS